MTLATIGFLGTGLMGGPMVRNLLAAGHRVQIWNRTRARASALAGAGAVIADGPANAIEDADIVISMLSDGKATAAVMETDGVLPALSSGAIWIEMASVRPADAAAQSELLSKHDADHLDAPVSGGTAGAEAATLAIMVGGEKDAFAKAAPVLRAMGRPVHVGPSGSGQLAKLANQAIVGIAIGAVSEAMLLLERGGADPAAVRDALKGGFADSTVLQQHGARMTDRDFDARGRASLHLKDLENALEAAGDSDTILPLTKSLRDRFQRLCGELDGADLDHAALFLELLDQNGKAG